MPHQPMIKIVVALLMLLFSTTGFSSPGLTLKVGEGEHQQEISKATMDSPDTAIGLEALFDIYYYSDRVDLECQGQTCQPKDGEVAPPAPLCFVGDANQVCSLISSLSRFGQQLYTDGDHQMAKLTGCRILGGDGSVQANILLISDYLEYQIKILQTFKRC